MSDPNLLGQPASFEFAGVAYPITSPRTFEIEAAFVRWVQEEAYRALLPHKDLLGPAMFLEQVKGWRHDLGAKVYAWGKQACEEARHSPEGVKEMAYQQFCHAHARLTEAGRPPAKAMTRETLEAVMKDPVKGEELVRLVLGLVEDPADPNA